MLGKYGAGRIEEKDKKERDGCATANGKLIIQKNGKIIKTK